LAILAVRKSYKHWNFETLNTQMTGIREEFDLLRRTKREFEDAVEFINHRIGPFEKGLVNYL
jgi:hypothetical protein